MVRTDLWGIFCRSLLVLTKVLFSICSSGTHYHRVCPAVIVGVSNHHCRRRRRCCCCLVIISRLSWQGQSFRPPPLAPFWHIHSNCFVFRGCACCDCLCCLLKRWQQYVPNCCGIQKVFINIHSTQRPRNSLQNATSSTPSYPCPI